MHSLRIEKSRGWLQLLQPWQRPTTRNKTNKKYEIGRKYLDALARRGAGLVYGDGKQVDRGKEDFGAQGGNVRKD